MLEDEQPVAKPRSVRLFNKTLHSYLDLRPNFLDGGPDPDLTVCVAGVEGKFERKSVPGKSGQTTTQLSFGNPSRIDFTLSPDTIICKPYSMDRVALEITFLGQVMAVWMESRGALMFHAGAVSIEHQTVGFMGNNGAGKSTLTSMFVSDGAPLVTDDVLAVVKCNEEYQSLPSYPSMRMWPATARMLGVDYVPLERVHASLEKRFVPVGTGHFGSFGERPAPLKRIYVLGERCPGRHTRIQPISTGEAIYELAKHSFAGRKLHKLGVTAQRFNELTALAVTNCVKRMSIPEGIESFDDIKTSIHNDLAADTGE